MNKLVEAMVRRDMPSGIEQLDVDTIKDALTQIRDRFVQERISGWTHPTMGYQAPVSPEEAERRWETSKQSFAGFLARGQSDPELRQRLGIGRRSGHLPASSDYSDPEGGSFEPPPIDPEAMEQKWQGEPPGKRSARAMRDEPSLRRGESRSRQILKNLLA